MTTTELIADSVTTGMAAPLVLVVDDDPLVRGALDSLFRSVGMRTFSYGSAEEALTHPVPEEIGCLVVDVRMPKLSGLEFQSRLVAKGDCPPIVFMTGHGDITMSVRAMKAGAVDFLPKPFREQEMLDAVMVALEKGHKRRVENERTADLRKRLDTLTPRERQVMKLVASGLMNKQVAAELGLSEVTVKLHRGSLMRKMEARSLVELARMWETLDTKDNRG